MTLRRHGSIALALLAVWMAIPAAAMHNTVCPAPSAFSAPDLSTCPLPPGHAKHLKERILKENPATTKKLLECLPARAVWWIRNNPQEALDLMFSSDERAQVLAAIGDEAGDYSACIPQERLLGGEPVTAIERDADTPREIRGVRHLDFRITRLSGGTQSYDPGRPITVRGFGIGHDLRVTEVKQDGAVVTDQVWNPLILPTIPTRDRHTWLVGATFNGSVSTPTVPFLQAAAAKAMQEELENSDPDGPNGPLPPTKPLTYEAWPVIIDLGDLTGCDWYCAHERARQITGWQATEPGEGFQLVMDGANAPERWTFAGVNFLGPVPTSDQPFVINLGATLTAATTGTREHERAHGDYRHHAEGISGCLRIIPGLQGVIAPCFIQPYGFRVDKMGSSSVNAPASPLCEILLPDPDGSRAYPLSRVGEITGPGRYEFQCYHGPDAGVPGVLWLKRSDRPQDYLTVAGWCDAPRTPLNAREGVFYQTRNGDGWCRPLAVNCQDASTGHLDRACKVGERVQEPITGLWLSLESESGNRKVLLVESGVSPTTTLPPPTTTTTLPPEAIVISYVVRPRPPVQNEPADFELWARRGSETGLRVPTAVEWKRPTSIPVERRMDNPVTITFTASGYQWIEHRVLLDGVWSPWKASQVNVDPGVTTTTVSTTSTTSSVTSTTVVTTTTTLVPTTSTIATTTTLKPPTTTTTIARFPNGWACSSHSDCQSGNCRTPRGGGNREYRDHLARDGRHQHATGVCE